MQAYFKEELKRKKTFNPCWWVVGFGALFVCLTFALTLGKSQLVLAEDSNEAGVLEEASQEVNSTANSDDAASDEATFVTESDGLAYNPRHILLPQTGYQRAYWIALELGATMEYDSVLQYALLTLPENLTIDEVLQDERYASYWAEMERDYYAAVCDNPVAMPTADVDDPYIYFQKYLSYLNLQDAWDTTKGAGVTVAIVDTGIDYDNPEFEGRISSLSYNATTQRSVAQDGWEVVSDNFGHGTMVAGVLGASDNGSGIIGIAPECTLLVIKANCDSDGRFLSSYDLARGICYAVDNGADIINMSFGGSGTVFQSAINYAEAQGVICVAASGNSSSNEAFYPANVPYCVSVGALANGSYALADYSNFGHNDIVAPGTVYTTKMDGTYGYVNGTSFACPVTAGVIALYLSLYPAQTTQSIINRLLASATDVGDLGTDYYFGCGAVDVYRFLFEESITITLDYQNQSLTNETLEGFADIALWTLPTPSVSGTVFGGWFYDSACTQRVSLYRDLFTAGTTLYALWGAEEDVVPYVYVTLDNGKVEIRKYVGLHINDISEGILMPNDIAGVRVYSVAAGALDGRGTTYVSLPGYCQYIDPYLYGNSTPVLNQGVNGDRYIPSRSSSQYVLYSLISDSTAFTIPVGTRIIFANAFESAPSLTSVSVPSGVTQIGNSAFADLTALVSVSLPTSLQHIGDSAFEGCTALDLIQLPEGLLTIGKYAFYGTAITTLTVPTTVTFLGEGFCGTCKKLTTVSLPEGITYIPISAFYCCSKLSSVNVPTTVTSINQSAFAGCFLLTSITLPTGLTSIDRLAFNACYIQSITIPNGVVVLDDSTFYNAVYLSSITFPSGLKAIGDECFCNCQSLATIVLPDTITTLAPGIFGQCVNLRNVTFTHVTTGTEGEEENQTHHTRIYNKMFDSCSSLQVVTVPTGTLEIEPYAFNECSALTTLNGVTSITELGVGAFYECSALTQRIVLDDTLTEISSYAFFGCEVLTDVLLSVSLHSIGGYAFYNCSSLHTLYFSDDITFVGDYAFYNCSGLVTIPLADTIDDFRLAFRGASQLTDFTIPLSAEKLEGHAFDGCVSLSSISIGGNVTSVAPYAFNGCTGLKSVTVASDITIGECAFYGCNAIETMELPMRGQALKVYFDGNVVPASLTSVTVNDDNDIVAAAFFHCAYLTEVVLSGAITTIGENAFDNCTSVTNFILPTTITTIGANAVTDFAAAAYNSYDGVRYLPTSDNEHFCLVVLDDDEAGIVTFHEDTVMMVDEAFKGSQALTTVHLNSIAVISDEAFKDCTALEELRLPRTVTAVGNDAFAGCSLLEIEVPCVMSESLTETLSEYDTVVYHDMVSEVHNPTITDDGYTHHSCTYCDYAYDDNIIPNFADQGIRLIDAQNITVNALKNIVRYEDELNQVSYFKRISRGATIAELRTCLWIPSTPVAEDASGAAIADESTVLGTGMKLSVYDGDFGLIDQVTLVVNGDVNGDGEITITDMLLVKAVLLKKNSLDVAYSMAADINGDGEITITDFLMFKSHLLNKTFIE